MSLEAFQLNGPVVALSATTSSPTPTAFVPCCGKVRIYNSGSSIAFVHSGIGQTDATATTSHTPIAPGAVETFSVPTNHTHVSAITSVGNCTVYVQTGEGM